MAAPIGRIKIPLSLTAEARAWPTQPLRARREERVQKGGDFPAGEGGRRASRPLPRGRCRLLVLRGSSSHTGALCISVKPLISMILAFMVHRPLREFMEAVDHFLRKKKIHRGAFSHTQNYISQRMYRTLEAKRSINPQTRIEFITGMKEFITQPSE